MKRWQRLLKRYFERKLNEKRIRSYLEQRTTEEQNFSNSDLEVVRVSSVQRELTLVHRVEEFIDHLHGFIKEASAQESHLVVFPEYNFLDLLGLIPGLGGVNAFLNWQARRMLAKKTHSQIDLTQIVEQKLEKEQPESEKRDETVGVSPGPIFQAIAIPVTRAMEIIFAHFARHYGLYIYTGSYITQKDDFFYNVGALYGPTGEKIGQQKKIHLTPMEDQFALGRGEKLNFLSLPIGKILIPICMDATYFETFRMAQELGGEIVILPIANPEEYNMWMSLKGIWPRTQESYLYGVKASLNGWLAGMHYTGKAGIFAPIPLTPRKDGILKLAEDYSGNQLVSAKLDLKALKIVREQAEYFGDQNPIYEENYVQRVYFQNPLK